MIVIVCGGRDQSLGADGRDILDRMHKHLHFTEVVHGAASGIDRAADIWACSRGIKRKAFPADWDTYGKAAGRIRNEKMAWYLLMSGEEHCVIAFPGGTGTAHMIETAKERGITYYLCGEHNEAKVLSD